MAHLGPAFSESGEGAKPRGRSAVGGLAEAAGLEPAAWLSQRERRVASLVPPPRANLTRFHGVFAPGAQLRPFFVPQAGAEEARGAPQAAWC
ncbi:hypothetical protein F0U60_44180 [Archangium minus]|uniref:Uncharacterized protein n=1 Tax=Archangium minus TaxID=83450 RepID=A0ABY9X4M5_9BACT|nr:hypothetical protein F0U60_44180 [Archangium minus]